jgi:DUF4097 and DUF4098 domain-containing protein YvlB
MKGRTIAITLVSLMLLGVLALCGLTALGTYRWAQAQGIRYTIRHDDVSAQVTEKRTFQAESGMSLDVNNTEGDVSVSAVPGSKAIVIEVTKTGWGANDAEAQTTADALSVDMHQEAGRVVADFSPAEPDRLTFGTVRSPKASFKIQVPPDTDVTIRTTSGDLTLSGTTGKTVLDCSFGKLTVHDVQGEQNITGANSDLDLRNIQAENAPVSIDNSFGSVIVQSITAGKINVANTNGSIQLKDVKTDDIVSVQSSFDSIELSNVTGKGLEIVNDNGPVTLTESTFDDPIHVETSFDKIELSQVQANGYHLVNQNGAISLDGARGSLELSSSFGEIQVTNAEDAILKITNDNGKVTFSGSLDPDAEQSIETTMDDIQITLPASTAANLDITTTNSQIDSTLPVTLSGGVSEDNWSGKFNGGGPILHLHNENGAVKILELKK